MAIDARMKVQTYGVERSEDPRIENGSANVTDVVERLRVRGLAVVENVLSAAAVCDLNRRLDVIYARQCDEVGGEDNLLAISDADIVRSLFAYDDNFLDLCAASIIKDVAQGLIGQNIVLLMQNGIINRPDRLQFQTRWHRDLNYQHWVCSKPLAISALVALEDFNEQTGGTLFLPGSHKFPDFPSDHFVTEFEQTATAKAGSIIFFDAMTYHRTGVNKSNTIRRAINHVIGVPILAPQANIPALLDRPAPDDDWLAAYLGYRWAPMTSVAAWRQQRIRALAARSEVGARVPAA